MLKNRFFNGLLRNAVTIISLIGLLSLATGCVGKFSLKENAETGQDSGAPTAGTRNPAQYENLRDRLHAGFTLPPIENRRVTYYEEWYADRPEYISAMMARARLYLFHIIEEVEKRGMPSEIALLPAIESAFKPQAYSRARAAGLWQFIPSTGRRYGLKQNWWYDGRRNVIDSTTAALDYLEALHEKFNGDWHLALAAYNAGENKIQRAMYANQKKGRPTAYQALRLRRETRYYVPKLMAIVNIVKDPAKYGLQWAPIPNRPYFTRVDVGGQIDLGVVASLTAMEVDDLYDLNPGFRRWATDPRGPHELLIPVEKAATLHAGLSDLPDAKRMQWTRYAVRQGDSLNRIAERYRISVAAIKSTNKLRGNLIRAGQNLLIPLSSRKLTRIKTTRVAASSGKRRSSVAKGARQTVHRVRKGDTLWGIAQKYNVYVHQLAKWNEINARDVLKLGQRILVWTR